jgi:hypothetical protein
MRKFNLTLLFLLTLYSLSFARQTIIPYRGIYADDPDGTAGIYNPERGFRLEVAVDIARKCDYGNRRNIRELLIIWNLR